jgi:hypothetical protein
VIIAIGAHWTAALAEDQPCGLARRTGHVNGPTITTGPPLIQGRGHNGNDQPVQRPHVGEWHEKSESPGIAGGKLTEVLGTATLTRAAGGPAGAMRFLTRRRSGSVLLGLAVAAAAMAATVTGFDLALVWSSFLVS